MSLFFGNLEGKLSVERRQADPHCLAAGQERQRRAGAIGELVARYARPAICGAEHQARGRSVHPRQARRHGVLCLFLGLSEINADHPICGNCCPFSTPESFMDLTDKLASTLPDPGDLPPCGKSGELHPSASRPMAESQSRRLCYGRRRGDCPLLCVGISRLGGRWVALDAEDIHLSRLSSIVMVCGVVALEVPGGAMDASDAGTTDRGGSPRAEGRNRPHGVRMESNVGALSPNPATHSNLSHIVLARNVEISAKPADDPTERIRLIRIPIRQAIKLALEGKDDSNDSCRGADTSSAQSGQMGLRHPRRIKAD